MASTWQKREFWDFTSCVQSDCPLTDKHFTSTFTSATSIVLTIIQLLCKILCYGTNVIIYIIVCISIPPAVISLLVTKGEHCDLLTSPSACRCEKKHEKLLSLSLTQPTSASVLAECS